MISIETRGADARAQGREGRREVPGTGPVGNGSEKEVRPGEHTTGGRADPGGGLRDVTTQRLQDPGRTQARRTESAFPEHSWWPGQQQSLQGASGTFATAEMTVLQEERLDRDMPCCQLRKTTSQPPKKREQAAYVP